VWWRRGAEVLQAPLPGLSLTYAVREVVALGDLLPELVRCKPCLLQNGPETWQGVGLWRRAGQPGDICVVQPDPDLGGRHTLVMPQHTVPDPEVDERGRDLEQLGSGATGDETVGPGCGEVRIEAAAGRDGMLLADGEHAGIGPRLAGAGAEALGVESFGDLMVG